MGSKTTHNKSQVEGIVDKNPEALESRVPVRILPYIELVLIGCILPAFFGLKSAFIVGLGIASLFLLGVLTVARATLRLTSRPNKRSTSTSSQPDTDLVDSAKSKNSECSRVAIAERTSSAEPKKEVATLEKTIELEEVLDALPIALAYATPDRKIKRINRAFSKVFGYSPHEAIGKQTGMLYLDPVEFEQQGKVRFHPDAPVDLRPYEVNYKRKNNEVFVGETIGTAVHDASGKTVGMLGLVLDISVRKETEKALLESKRLAEESEHRFRALANAASPLCWTTELDSKASWFNDRWLEYCGRTMEEQTGFGWLESVHPEDQERTKDVYLSAFEKKGPFSLLYRLLRQDGEYRWHTVNATPRFDNQGKMVGYVGMSFDTQEAQEYREALESSENALREASASQQAMINLLGASDGVWDWKVGTDELIYAPGYRRMLGFDSGDVQTFPNKRSSSLQRVHPDDLAGLNQAINFCLCEKMPFEYEFRMQNQEGKYRWYRSRGAPSFDEKGNPIRLVGSTHDIHAQKLAEKSIAVRNQELMQANRDLEQFASVASHDLKEPLRAVSGFAQMIQKRYQSNIDEKGQEYLVNIVDGVGRMQKLIEDLMRFNKVRRSKDDLKPVDLGTCAQVAVQQLAKTVEETQTEVKIDNLPKIAGIESQLIQLFQNLIGNAIKYRSTDSPVIKITCESSGSDWVISVKDNGIGIPPEYHAQIFQIFKRLHHREDYPGTGIGLAICQRVVDTHGGTISLSSNNKEGACFDVKLPKLIALPN